MERQGEPLQVDEQCAPQGMGKPEPDLGDNMRLRIRSKALDQCDGDDTGRNNDDCPELSIQDHAPKNDKECGSRLLKRM